VAGAAAQRSEHMEHQNPADHDAIPAVWRFPAGRDVPEGQDPVLPAARTAEPRVDAALRLLDRLPGLPVSEHPELYEEIHAQLSDVLGDLDTGPGMG
jgi:hypothetical protein